MKQILILRTSQGLAAGDLDAAVQMLEVGHWQIGAENHQFNIQYHPIPSQTLGYHSKYYNQNEEPKNGWENGMRSLFFCGKKMEMRGIGGHRPSKVLGKGTVGAWDSNQHVWAGGVQKGHGGSRKRHVPKTRAKKWDHWNQKNVQSQVPKTTWQMHVKTLLDTLMLGSVNAKCIIYPSRSTMSPRLNRCSQSWRRKRASLQQILCRLDF